MNSLNKRYIEKIQRNAGRAINEFGLIKKGDRVAVALSGGIDSMVLLEILVSRIARVPIRYEISAVHVTMRNAPYAVDVAALKRFCDANRVALHVPEITLERRSENEGLCFSCAFLRRKALFDWMKEYQFNRLAFGHHLDDAVETLFLNMVYQANFSTMPPRISLFAGEFDIIRPLIYLSSDEIRTYASSLGISPAASPCPYGSKTNREKIKKMLSDLEKQHPNAKKNIFAAMENIRSEYLPIKTKKRREL